MTTGPEGSAYREFGERYRTALARDGVQLKLEPSLGNVENLVRLNDAASGVSVGFAASGLTTEKASPGIESLGTISYDPIWIFCRGLSDEAQFGELRGKRLSIDPQGSVMLDLLRAMGLEKEVTIVPLAPAAGGEALLRGEVDCACMLTVADDPIVKSLLADDGVNLVTAQRADALVALYPYLSKVTIPRGVGSLEGPPGSRCDARRADGQVCWCATTSTPPCSTCCSRLPRTSTRAPASCAGRASFRPPSRRTSRCARGSHNYYKSGGSFFQRHLPFWLAVIASRLLVVLVPLVGLLYPLVRVLPLVLGFVFERRVNALYTELRRIDARVDAGDRPGKSRGSRPLGRGDRTDPRSASRAREIFALKQHASLVGDRLRTARATGSGDPETL